MKTVTEMIKEFMTKKQDLFDKFYNYAETLDEETKEAQKIHDLFNWFYVIREPKRSQKALAEANRDLDRLLHIIKCNLGVDLTEESKTPESVMELKDNRDLTGLTYEEVSEMALEFMLFIKVERLHAQGFIDDYVKERLMDTWHDMGRVSHFTTWENIQKFLPEWSDYTLGDFIESYLTINNCNYSIVRYMGDDKDIMIVNYDSVSYIVNVSGNSRTANSEIVKKLMSGDLNVKGLIVDYKDTEGRF